MGYEKRIVCYFDILGFRTAVCGGRISAEEIDKMFRAIDVIMEDSGGDVVDGVYFSDSFVVSIKLTVGAIKQLNFIVRILEKLVEYHFLARGGIAYGDVVHERTRVYGPALIRAVDAEGKAHYPRIIADDSLHDVVMPAIGSEKIDYLNFLMDFVFIKKDEVDGLPYIDYISSIIKRNRPEDAALVRAKLERMIAEGMASDRSDIVEKYAWVKEKLG